MSVDYSTVDALKKKLHSLRPLNPLELKRLREEFAVENTYDSNAIEGSTLTLRETALILQQGITIAEKPLRDHLDAVGHKDAFEYIMALADRCEVLDERVIRDIHSLVLMNDAENRGVYRRVPVTILGALVAPPPPYMVQEELKKLLDDYARSQGKLHPIDAISGFHLRFEGIHPFVDGNGRTGRLILNLELVKAGYLPVNIKFSDRRKYYDSFDSYYGGAHLPDALAQLIAGYEADELKRYISIIEACPE